MTVTPKKVCFLHFSCSPHSSTRPNCLYNLCSKSGQKIGKEFDFAQVRTLFFFPEKTGSGKSGKNPEKKFQEFLTDIAIWNIPWDDKCIRAIFFLQFSTILMFLKLPFFSLQLSLWTNMSKLIFTIIFGFIMVTNNRFLW